MVAIVVALVVLVQIVQMGGDWLVFYLLFI